MGEFDSPSRIARQHYRELDRPSAEASYNAELNRFNPYFDEVRELLPKEKWEEIWNKFVKIQIEDLDMEDGIEPEDYARQAAALRDFNQDYFDGNYQMDDRIWRHLVYDLKASTDDAEDFLNFAVNLKTIDPVRFDKELKDSVKKMMPRILALLLENSHIFIDFIDLYARAVKLDEQEIRRLYPIPQDQWQEMAGNVLSINDTGGDPGFIMSNVQFMRPPQAQPRLAATAKNWATYKGLLQKDVDKGRFDEFLDMARHLKTLEVKFPKNSGLRRMGR